MSVPYVGLVLLVDDDAELRRALATYLTASGCAVVEARDAYDGLFCCAQYGDAIGLIITEINLLPVSGVKLAENALRLWPRMQVLCTSANADAKGVRYWMNYLNAEFLPKPFTAEQFHQKVFPLLDRHKAAVGLPQGGFPRQAPLPGGDADPARYREPGRDGPKAESNSRNPMFWLTEF
jgi:DNA-binding NtrC family response regulator